jgi:hypothetical protein
MSDGDEPRRKRVKAIPIDDDEADDEPRRKRVKAIPIDDDEADDEPRTTPGFASKLLRKSVLIPTGTLLLGLIVGSVVVSLVGGSSGSGGSGSSGGSGGVSPAKMSGQEKRDYERVTTLEMEFARIKRQESQELEDANRTAGQLDRPGAGRDRMTAALGRADVREKRKQEVQMEYGMIVRQYPHWGKPATLT